MDLRKIGVINKDSDTRYITLPKGWGKVGGIVIVQIISDTELKINFVNDENLEKLSK